MTDGCYRQVGCAQGYSPETADPTGARAVVEPAHLRDPVQQDVPLNVFVFPARTGTELPAAFTDFAAKARPALAVAGRGRRRGLAPMAAGVGGR
jgi:ABC-type thiamine transport system substrate-binding protein